MYASSSSSSSSIFPSCSTIRARNVIATIAIVILLLSSSYAKLSSNFYTDTCPKLFTTVKGAVESAIKNETRMGASLLRLHFHDCFIQGCDASILLDDIPGKFTGEKTAVINNNSARGFNYINEIKSAVEKVCPGVVSCADIIAIAARDSVAKLGGPSYLVQLGRRDSRTASFSLANGGAVPSIFSNLTVLIETFGNVGLSPTDTVALSGAHTIGDARCVTYRRRIYNETNINARFAYELKKICPSTQGIGDANLTHFDRQTPYLFDNKYYDNLMNQKGLLHTDQILRDGGNITIASLVEQYSRDQNKFFIDFGAAMIKMGNIAVLTGSQGEIRKDCTRVNTP